jgi:hypothetical protein
MFIHRLALALSKTVAELLRDTTAPELAGWAAFFDVEPLHNSADQRTALVCSTLARLQGRRMTTRDFMPTRRRRYRQSASEQIAVFKKLN